MRDVLTKFWARVDATADPDDCWPWRTAIDHDGYGQFCLGHRIAVRAHRFSLEIATGEPIPPGLCVLHSCDNPPCVNPAHLRVGTRAENMRDCLVRGRHPNRQLTHCKHGHEFTPENTRVRLAPRNGRVCRSCQAENERRRRARQASLLPIRHLALTPERTPAA